MEPKQQPKIKKALSIRDVMTKKYSTIPFTGAWLDTFGEPERTGTWLIWGNKDRERENGVQ
jgi:hypothetical protein